MLEPPKLFISTSQGSNQSSPVFPFLAVVSTSPENKKSFQRQVEKLKKGINDRSYIVAMDEHGIEFSSREFASLIEKLTVSGKEQIAFLLGGYNGLELELSNKANKLISLSRMTFTQQIVRLIFIEQLYRAFTIIQGEAYHH